MRDVDVAVVGGGIAGLTAAQEVAAAGRAVLVLEARERVGGRTAGHTLDNGAEVGMGGTFVGPLQTEVLALIDRLGLETFPTYDEGDGLTVLHGTVTRHNDETFGLPEASLPEIGRLQAELESLAATVPLSSPWMAPDAETLDRQTFEDWLTTNSSDEVALSFYRFVASGIFAAESWELSLLHVLFYIRSNGMLDNLLSTSGGNQERRVVGGAHCISERMAEELGAEALRLGARVYTIAQHDDAVSVGYDGGQVLAGRVIVALPPTLAGRLRYEPPLPARRDGLTQQVPMGCAILFQAIYPTPFWRDDGLSGEVFSFDGPLPAMFDGSPPDGSFGALVGVFGGDYARLAAEQPPEVRRKLVLDSLTKFFGPMAAEPVEYLEKDWMAEEFTRGCYGGHFGVGVWTRYGKALIEPVGHIHWAGTETADVSNGYRDGAVRSGRRAAREALDSLG